MTKAEYEQGQRDITKLAHQVEKELEKRIHKSVIDLLMPLVKNYITLGVIKFPAQELSAMILTLIQESGKKTIAATRKLQEVYEKDIAQRLGIDLTKKPEKSREPFALERRTGQGWGAGITPAGKVIGWEKDKADNVTLSQVPLEYLFQKRHDLSTNVWKSVEDMEGKVFDVLRGGRALGRNIKDIATDLEQYIKYPDGGKRVQGRWLGMFPNTEKGRREAWKRQYLAEHGGLQFGTDEAKALLKTPEAKALIGHRASTALGASEMPDAVKQYTRRLGSGGLDYRAIRFARTETAEMLASEQERIAKDSAIATGEIEFVMAQGRDHQNCNCEKHAGKVYHVDDPDRPIIPVHPNCVPAGTRILTPQGERNIEDIRKGDEVIGYSLMPCYVTDVLVHEYTGEMISINDVADFTPEHPILIVDPCYQYVNANDVMLGDWYLLYVDGVMQRRKVFKLFRKPVSTRVYNLTVEDEHTFFANGILTHNCHCEWRPKLKSRQQILKDYGIE